MVDNTFMKHLKKIITLLLLATVTLYCKTDKPQKTIEDKTETKIKQQPPKTVIRNNISSILKKAIREAAKKTTRIKIDSIINDLMRIKHKSFYTITIGDSFSAYKNILIKDSLKNVKANLYTHSLYDKNNNKLAIMYPDPAKEGTIKSIEIITKDAKTKNGISIGMTFGDLLKKNTNIVVKSSEIDGLAYISHGEIRYFLDIYFNPNMVDNTKVKRTAKIKSIIIK